MIDVKMMQESIKLGQLYENRWGKEVDFVGMPSSIGQHKLLLVMRLIVDTGDSVLVGYQKIKKLVDPYYKYLMSIERSKDGDVVDKRCPLCGENVKFYQMGNSYEYRCDTPNCISFGARGI